MLTFSDVERLHVPAGSIALWWLGQSGYLIKSPGGRVIVIDPYLSNSCKAIGESIGVNMDRMVPIPMRPGELAGVGMYVMTHSHQDHLDPETVAGFLQAGGNAPFVAPVETVERLKSLGISADRCEVVWPNKVIQHGDLEVRATFAIPLGGDDLNHVGFLLSVAGGPRVYLTGDTAYHPVLAAAMLPHKPDVLIAVVNGAFRNMNPAEAAQLAKELDVRVVIPCHYDLFPDNSVPPRLLRTNLVIAGVDTDRYRELTHGEPFLFSSGKDEYAD
jgi:L-ascorbate 6-phosphate lactonase